METTKRDRRREEEEEDESFTLPPEIITEILLRLPAKSIGRFRSVSKLFRSLSSDPKFAKLHIDLLLRNNYTHRKLIVSSHNLFSLDFDSIGYGITDLPSVELNYPLKDNPSIFAEMIRTYVKDHLYNNGNAKPYRRNWVEIVGSTNGLVCISPGEGSLFLYNPTTGESKRLPENSRSKCEQFQTYGFGYDDVADDYKVVKLIASINDDVLNVIVYSLWFDTWRRINDLSYEHNDGFSSGVCFNGAVHWVLSKGNERVIVAFDVKTEEFREIALPDEDCDHRFKNFVVGCVSGCLCVVYSCYEVHDDVWVMDVYGVASSWRRIRISLMYRSMKPLCSSKNDEEALLELDGDMVLYNFEKGTSRNLGICGVKLSDGFEANTYVESLISPNSYGT